MIVTIERPLSGRIRARNTLGHFRTGKNGKIQLGWLEIVTEHSSANFLWVSFEVKFLKKINKNYYILQLKSKLEILQRSEKYYLSF